MPSYAGSSSTRGSALARGLLRTRVWVRVLTFQAVLAILIVLLLILLNSPRTRITEVRAEGGSPATNAAAKAVMKKAVGRNVFRVPVRSYRSRIRSISRIESATVDRDLPHTLVAHVKEREPLARISYRGRLCLLDPTMVPYVQEDLRPSIAPLLEVGGGPAPRVGKKWKNEYLDIAVEVLAEARKKQLEPSLVQIDRAGDICLNVPGRVQIRMGSARDIELKLRIANEFLSSEQVPPASVQYIDVSSPSVPVYRPRK